MDVKMEVIGRSIRLADGRYRKKGQTFKCDKKLSEHLLAKYPGQYVVVKEPKKTKNESTTETI